MQFKNIVSIESADVYCLTIKTKDEEWVLCPSIIDEDLEPWNCGIKEYINDNSIVLESPS